MRYKKGAIQLLLLLTIINAQLNQNDSEPILYKQIQVGEQISGNLEPNEINYYEIELAKTNLNYDLVLLIQSKENEQPSFDLDFNLGNSSQKNQKKRFYCHFYYTNICIIPKDFVNENIGLKELAKVYLEIECVKFSKQICKYAFKLGYQEKLKLQFSQDYKIQIEAFDYKQIVLDFNNLDEGQVFPSILAQVLPLDYDLNKNKFSFTTRQQILERIKSELGFPIWQNGLGIALRDANFTKNSTVEFMIYTFSQQTFTFQTSTNKLNVFSDIQMNYLFEKEYLDQIINLNKIIDRNQQISDQQQDLVLTINHYFGDNLLIKVYSQKAYEGNLDPNWTFKVDGSQRIVLKAQERLAYSQLDEIYYVKFQGEEEDDNDDDFLVRSFYKREKQGGISFSVNYSLFANSDSLPIQFGDTLQESQQKDELTNYLFKLYSADLIQINIKIINTLGANQIFVKKCDLMQQPTCKITENEIIDFQNSKKKRQIKGIFIAKNVFNTTKVTFVHAGLCGESTECQYSIAIKGSISGSNKFSLRLKEDGKRTLLQNNIPHKDKILKSQYKFYKFVIPPFVDEEKIDFKFIVDEFLGTTSFFSSLNNFAPDRNFYYFSNGKSKIFKKFDISRRFNKRRTVFITIFGESDSFFSITPQITFAKRVFDYDPGMRLIDGGRQSINFSQNQSIQYFYLKVPLDNSNQPVQFSLNITSTQGKKARCRIFVDKKQKIIRENPQKAAFKNDENSTQIQFQKEDLNRKEILFGMIQLLDQTLDKQNTNSLVLSYDTGIFELEINRPHNLIFRKKRTQYFKFQIKKIAYYYIAFDLDYFQIYLSLDHRIKKPNQSHRTIQFNSRSAYIINQNLLRKYCTFLDMYKNEQPCYAYLAIYYGDKLDHDVLSQITVSTQNGSAIQIFEEQKFETGQPIGSLFSYFFHELKPYVEHTKIVVKSRSSRMKVYASVITEDSQNNIPKKDSFPNSQKSQYQSVESEHSSFIQIHTKDIIQCSSNICKVLITVHYNQSIKLKSYNQVSLKIINDQHITELVKEKDFQLSENKNEITYFKYYLDSDVSSLKLELFYLIDENDYAKYHVFDFNKGYFYLSVSNSTEGIPNIEIEKKRDDIHDSIQIQKNDGQPYLNKGMYYFAVQMAKKPKNDQVVAQLFTNQKQIIQLICEFEQELSLESQEIAYLVFDLYDMNYLNHYFQIYLSLITLEKTQGINITIYGDNEYAGNQHMIKEKEIEEIINRNKILAHNTQDFQQIIFEYNEDIYLYVAKIQSQDKHKISFYLHPEQEEIKLGDRFLKVFLQPNIYRVLSNYGIYNKISEVRIIVLSGSIEVSLINHIYLRDMDEQNWLNSKQIIERLAFNQQTTMIIQIPSKKDLFIENPSNESEASFIIEELQEYRQFNATPNKYQIVSDFNRAGVVTINIENPDEIKTIYQLSIYNYDCYFQELKGEKFPILNFKLTPLQENSEFHIIDQKQVQNVFFYEFEMKKGKSQLNITSVFEYKKNINPIIFSIHLNTQEVKHILSDLNYYSIQTSKSVKIFKYFREEMTSFIVEIFDCAGNTTLAISDNLEEARNFTTSQFMSNFMRTKSYGNYKFYTFATSDSYNQEKGKQRPIFYDYTRIHIGAQPSSFDTDTVKAEYILRVSSFRPKNNEFNMLQFDQFIQSDDNILVEEINDTKGKMFRFSAQVVSCQNDCKSIYLQVNYVAYELYLASSLSSLQDYSVCHTNLTDYQDFNLQTFPLAKSSIGQLILRKSIKIKGLAGNSNSGHAVFDILMQDLFEYPKDIFYTIVATVNVQEQGLDKSQNIPIFYKKDMLPGGWQEKCTECQIQKKENENKEQTQNKRDQKGSDKHEEKNKGEQEEKNQEKNEEKIEEKNKESNVAHQENSGQELSFFALILVMILLAIIVVVFLLKKIFSYVKHKRYNLIGKTSSQSYELKEVDKSADTQI
ncbi:hypothetical protein ABPG74_010145 [Tetrahymena malaccensis]